MKCINCKGESVIIISKEKENENTIKYEEENRRERE
jgi:hypothetical protein